MSMRRYVENGSLLHTLNAFGNLSEALVASYVVKILEGLSYLHSVQVTANPQSNKA
jgi:serine/threonine protein kinase